MGTIHNHDVAGKVISTCHKLNANPSPKYVSRKRYHQSPIKGPRHQGNRKRICPGRVYLGDHLHRMALEKNLVVFKEL